MPAAVTGQSPGCRSSLTRTSCRAGQAHGLHHWHLSASGLPTCSAAPSTSRLPEAHARGLVMTKARRWYAVFEPVTSRGVYRVWDQVKQLVTGYSNAKHRGFPSEAAAYTWIEELARLTLEQEQALVPLRQRVAESTAAALQAAAAAATRTSLPAARPAQPTAEDYAASSRPVDAGGWTGGGARGEQQDPPAADAAAGPKPWETDPIVLDVPAAPTRAYFRKFYAVRYVDGGRPGVYNTWEETQAVVSGGYSEYKSFKSYAEAVEFAFGPQEAARLLQSHHQGQRDHPNQQDDYGERDAFEQQQYSYQEEEGQREQGQDQYSSYTHPRDQQRQQQGYQDFAHRNHDALDDYEEVVEFEDGEAPSGIHVAAQQNQDWNQDPGRYDAADVGYSYDDGNRGSDVGYSYDEHVYHPAQWHALPGAQPSAFPRTVLAAGSVAARSPQVNPSTGQPLPASPMFSMAPPAYQTGTPTAAASPSYTSSALDATRQRQQQQWQSPASCSRPAVQLRAAATSNSGTVSSSPSSPYQELWAVHRTAPLMTQPAAAMWAVAGTPAAQGDALVDPVLEPKKRGRGRPRKPQVAAAMHAAAAETSTAQGDALPDPVQAHQRRRGRPRKTKVVAEAAAAASVAAAAVTAAAEGPSAPQAAKRGRGRPRKSQVSAEAAVQEPAAAAAEGPSASQPVTRPCPGRPPKCLLAPSEPLPAAAAAPGGGETWAAAAAQGSPPCKGVDPNVAYIVAYYAGGGEWAVPSGTSFQPNTTSSPSASTPSPSPAAPWPATAAAAPASSSSSSVAGPGRCEYAAVVVDPRDRSTVACAAGVVSYKHPHEAPYYALGCVLRAARDLGLRQLHLVGPGLPGYIPLPASPPPPAPKPRRSRKPKGSTDAGPAAETADTAVKGSDDAASAAAAMNLETSFQICFDATSHRGTPPLPPSVRPLQTEVQQLVGQMKRVQVGEDSGAQRCAIEAAQLSALVHQMSEEWAWELSREGPQALLRGLFVLGLLQRGLVARQRELAEREEQQQQQQGSEQPANKAKSGLKTVEQLRRDLAARQQERPVEQEEEQQQQVQEQPAKANARRRSVKSRGSKGGAQSERRPDS